MALVTIDDVAVIKDSSFIFPRIGVWSFDLIIDQPDGSGFEAGKKVTIKAGDQEFKGTVAADRSGSVVDSIHVRVLGGAGALAKPVKARGYAAPQAFVKDVLKGIFDDVGESASTSIPADVQNTNINAWATFVQPAAHALGAFLDTVTPGAPWRVLPDGKIWTGPETWPSSSPSYTIVDQVPSEGLFILGVTSMEIQPGQTVDGIGKIARVEYSITPDGIRADVWTFNADEDRGPRASVAAICRQEMAGIDFYGLYDSKVEKQSADGTTVDVTPADKRLPGLQRVPLRLGLPNCTVQFSPGAIVRLGWDRGDPRYPYAALFNGGESVTKLVVGTQLAEIAGNAFKALKSATFLADLATALGQILASNGGGPILTDPTKVATLITNIGLGTYESDVLKHG